MVVAALLLALFVLSSNIKPAESGPEDCIDACFTGCVNINTRVMQRCEGKCRIRCGPGFKGND